MGRTSKKLKVAAKCLPTSISSLGELKPIWKDILSKIVQFLKSSLQDLATTQGFLSSTRSSYSRNEPDWIKGMFWNFHWACNPIAIHSAMHSVTTGTRDHIFTINVTQQRKIQHTKVQRRKNQCCTKDEKGRLQCRDTHNKALVMWDYLSPMKLEMVNWSCDVKSSYKIQINWTKIGKRLFAFQQNLFVTNNIHLWQSRSWSCQFISRNVHTNAVCLSSDKLMERRLFMGTSRYLVFISTSPNGVWHATASLWQLWYNVTMSQCHPVTMSR